MKKNLHLLAFFLSTLVLNSLNAVSLKETISKFPNPFDGKVFLLTEESDIKEGLLGETLRSNPNFDSKLLRREYLFYSKDGKVHLRDVSNSKEYLIDAYVDKYFVYVTDSRNPSFVDIYNIDDEQTLSILRCNDLYVDLFNLGVSKLANSEPGDVNAELSENEYILTWLDGDKSCMLFLDKHTGFPTEMVRRFSDGDLLRTVNISQKTDGFVITTVFYRPQKELFFKTTVTLTHVPKSDFPRAAIPENLGFRTVNDRRGGQIRRYVVYDKIPPESFINELFKNLDDVVRYNNEIHRLAHPNSEIDE